MLRRFVCLSCRRSAVVVVQSEPIFGSSMARFTRNPGDHPNAIAHFLPCVMTAHAGVVSLHALEPQFFDDFLRFGLSVERFERGIVGCSFPLAHFVLVTLGTRLGTQHVSRVALDVWRFGHLLGSAWNGKQAKRQDYPFPIVGSIQNFSFRRSVRSRLLYLDIHIALRYPNAGEALIFADRKTGLFGMGDLALSNGR